MDVGRSIMQVPSEAILTVHGTDDISRARSKNLLPICCALRSGVERATGFLPSHSIQWQAGSLWLRQENERKTRKRSSHPKSFLRKCNAKREKKKTRRVLGDGVQLQPKRVQR
jgi:hypothetical protein